MSVLVSGSLAFDRIMNFDGRFKDHILPDKIHILNVSFQISQFRQSFGGTAGNIAYNLALLGVEPVILCSHGNDFGDYEAWLRKHKVVTQYSRQVNKMPTASVYIITDRSDNQIAGFFPGAMLYANGKIPKNILKSADLAIVSPGNLRDMKEYPEVFKKNKIPFIFDPGQQIPVLSKRDLIRSLSGALAFISNDYELSLVLKKTGLSRKGLLQKVKMVVITKGEKGSIIETAEGKRIMVPPAKPKNDNDPTGAGDAYRSGFIAGLLNKFPLEKAGRLAATVSVYTVERYGTQTHQFSKTGIAKRFKDNFKIKLWD